MVEQQTQPIVLSITYCSSLKCRCYHPLLVFVSCAAWRQHHVVDWGKTKWEWIWKSFCMWLSKISL